MSAQDRGWGPGWPNCDYSKIVTVVLSNGVRLPVRREIAQLVGWLSEETMRRGYDLVEGWCWGYACRPIANTSTPSNHSWGLAVDLNAPNNPYTDRLVTDMPSWMPRLWTDYGFRWGGTYSGKKDAMHYEFMGTPDDARRHTAAIPDPTPVPPSQEDDVPIQDGPDMVRWQKNLNYVITTQTPVSEDGKWGPTTQGRTDGWRGIWGLPKGGRPSMLDVSKMDRHIHEVKEHRLHLKYRPAGP